MIKIGDQIQEYREQRADLYASLYQLAATASTQRFEHIARQAHILTIKIVNLKRGVKSDE